MSEALSMEGLEVIKEDHVTDGKYVVTITKVEMKKAKTGRDYASIQAKISDSNVETDGRIPKGEMLFPRFMCPMVTDKEDTIKFFRNNLAKFLQACGAFEHPDYAALDGTVANPALWDLATGAELSMSVKWKEQTDKVFNPETEKTDKVPNGEFQYDFSNYKAY
jgi:hypothetical protein